MTRRAFATSSGRCCEAARDAEVVGVVDDGLDPERPAVLEVLLDPAVLVGEVDLDVAAGGEDPGPEQRLGRLADLAGEHHRDLLGPADVDVVGDERFEEAAGAARVVEHERARHLDLPHRELPPVAGGAVLGVSGVGMTAIQRSKNACTSAGPNRSQIAWSRSGSAQLANPLLERRERDPGSRTACRLAHSCPFNHTLDGYGK